MKTAVITWTNPTTRASGHELVLDDLSHIEFSLSADLGANWAVAGTAKPLDADFRIADLEDGTYSVRAVWIDTDLRPSEPAEASFDIVGPPNAGTIEVALA